MGFKVMLILNSSVFALQIEAPTEIVEQISVYVREAGAESKNAILEVNVKKSTQCNIYNTQYNTFVLKLTDKYSGKIIKEVESCFTNLPNATLQNAVLEILGYPKRNSENSELSGNVKTVLIGTVFTVTGLLLYYSNPPKPVYGAQKLSEVKK
jgi:hypothetical protein